MGVTFGPGMVRALEERLAEVTAERDRLRDAIEDIPRHFRKPENRCGVCYGATWPCETERAHRIAEATRHGPDCLAGCCDGAKPPCGPCTCGRDEATS